MAVSEKQRDKHITRQIHRLFWQANFVTKFALAGCYIGRIPAVAAYNIFIPLVSAYAIQAILQGHLAKVDNYAIWVIVLALVYCAGWSFSLFCGAHNARWLHLHTE